MHNIGLMICQQTLKRQLTLFSVLFLCCGKLMLMHKASVGTNISCMCFDVKAVM